MLPENFEPAIVNLLVRFMQVLPYKGFNTRWMFLQNKYTPDKLVEKYGEANIAEAKRIFAESLV
jgi:hypothetical protein